MLEATNDLKARLQRLLERTLTENGTVHNAVLRVDAPGFTWKGAVGLADPARGVPMLPDTPFRSASVGKMFLAAALLTYVEEDLIVLDEPAARYISREWLDQISVIDGRSYGDVLTVRQLINHTSGIADYFSDGEGLNGHPPFVLEMLKEPDKLWDPREIINWTAQHLSARFSPGSSWHYNDTGFLLAGLIVEAVAGLPLHEVYRQRLFEALGMSHTYMVFREAPPDSSVQEANAYAGELLYTAPRTMSADWAGGGLVTTVDDLTRFIQAMVENRVFRKATTRDLMLTWIPTGEPGVYYGLGTRRIVLEEVGEGQTGELWGHTGALNVIMLHSPTLNLTITGTLNQSELPGVWSRIRPVSKLVPEVLEIMAQPNF